MLPAKARLPRRHPVVALRALALATFTGLAFAAAGCGSVGDTEQDEPLSTGDISLTVTLDPDGPGGDEPMVEEVSCDEDETEADCAAAGDLQTDDVAPVDPDTACTEIFGGPDELRIQGTLGDEGIDVELTRANGCEIERFDAALPLVQALFPDYEPGAAIGG